MTDKFLSKARRSEMRKDYAFLADEGGLDLKDQKALLDSHDAADEKIAGLEEENKYFRGKLPAFLPEKVAKDKEKWEELIRKIGQSKSTRVMLVEAHEEIERLKIIEHERDNLYDIISKISGEADGRVRTLRKRIEELAHTPSNTEMWRTRAERAYKRIEGLEREKKAATNVLETYTERRDFPLLHDMVFSVTSGMEKKNTALRAVIDAMFECELHGHDGDACPKCIEIYESTKETK